MLLDNVIDASFAALRIGNCAYGIVNDISGGLGQSWRNSFDLLYLRGCRQGFLNWAFDGSGAHTENYFAAIYFTGKEWDNETRVVCEDSPCRLQNCEGFTFGTFNYEWVDANGADFFTLIDDTTVVIESLHFEGNEKHDSGDTALFNCSNAGTLKTNVNATNLQLQAFVQTGGTFSLFRTTTDTKGAGRIGTISSKPSGNTFTDFRVFNANSKFSVDIGASAALGDYITSVRQGALPADFTPVVWGASGPYETTNFISNPGTTIDIGKASYMRLNGAAPGSAVTDIITTARDPLETMRYVVLENNTGGIIYFTNTGNLSRPRSTGWDVPLTPGDIAVILVFPGGNAYILMVTT